jgi:hypothetical protein
MTVVAAPAPTRVMLRETHSDVVGKVTVSFGAGLTWKMQVAVCLSAYVPAGTLMMGASDIPFALMMAPRRLQSFGVASSQFVALASSSWRSTSSAAACGPDGQAGTTAGARRRKTSQKTIGRHRGSK